MMYFEHIENFVTLHRELSYFLLIIVKIIGAVFMLPASPFTILAGVLFGVVGGVIVSLVGSVLGALCAFLVSRHLFGDFVTRRILSRHQTLRDYEHRLFENGFKTVLLMRFIPFLPFNVLNYFFGVTEVRTRDYFFATCIGIIPGTIAYVYFGDAIAMFNPYSIFMTIVALAGLFYIGRRYKRRKSPERHH